MFAMLFLPFLACVEAAPEPTDAITSLGPVTPSRWPAWSRPEVRPRATGGADGALLFEPGVIQELDLSLDADARDRLADDPRADVVATLRWRGEDYTVGLGLKGSSSFRTLDGKAAFKIDVHEWDPDARIDGLKRFSLNNMVADAAMAREHTYYWLCERLGVPVIRHTYARVRIDGELYGLYGLLEALDEQLVKRVWPSDEDGPLYEASGADFTRDRSWFELREEGVGLEVASIIDVVEDTPAEGWLPLLESHFDVDSLMTHLALDIVTGNPDGYVFNRHNYYVYGAPRAQRWFLTPWGTDRSFMRAQLPVDGDLETPEVGVLVVRCVEVTDCRERLYGRVREVAEAWETLDVVGHLDTVLALIADDCEADPRKEWGCDPDAFRDLVIARAQFVLDDLATR